MVKYLILDQLINKHFKKIGDMLREKICINRFSSKIRFSEIQSMNGTK
jgi:hypothetical protein